MVGPHGSLAGELPAKIPHHRHRCADAGQNRYFELCDATGADVLKHIATFRDDFFQRESPPKDRLVGTNDADDEGPSTRDIMDLTDVPDVAATRAQDIIDLTDVPDVAATRVLSPPVEKRDKAALETISTSPEKDIVVTAETDKGKRRAIDPEGTLSAFLPYL